MRIEQNLIYLFSLQFFTFSTQFEKRIVMIFIFRQNEAYSKYGCVFVKNIEIQDNQQ